MIESLGWYVGGKKLRVRKVVDDMWIGEDGKLGNVESWKDNGWDEMESRKIKHWMIYV